MFNHGRDTIKLDVVDKLDHLQVDEVTSHQDDASQGTRTRAGRVTRKPARYCMTVEGLSSQVEGGCKAKDHEMIDT